VNEEYMKSVIQHTGSNAALLVESALYHSMLENNRKELQSTLDIINKMSGIEDLNIYDRKEELAYSSFSPNSTEHSNPNCKECHEGIKTIFSKEENYHKIIDLKTECEMNKHDVNARHLLIYSPIKNAPSCYNGSCHAHTKDQEVLGSMVIKVPLKELDLTLEKTSGDFFLLASFTTILLLGFIIFFTFKRIKRPLHKIIKASEDVTTGNLGTRIKIDNNQLDDMRMVALAFNQMLDHLQSANTELQNWSQQLEYKVQKKSEELGQIQGELINIEKVASLGKLSLSVAHEINNPLSGILIYTKLIHKKLSSSDFNSGKKKIILKHLNMIENESKRCGDIVKGLLDFSRNDEQFFEERHLHCVLRDTYDLMSHSMKIAKINFEMDFKAERDLVICHPNQIKQVCIDILVNASESIIDYGEIMFRTYNADKDTITIEIEDNGIGIDEENLQYIFEAFFSTKNKSKGGAGLGLSIARGIIEDHNGTIEAKSVKGSGTKIIISLPLVKK
jgi:two-component system NtrC family sensor kinase